MYVAAVLLAVIITTVIMMMRLALWSEEAEGEEGNCDTGGAVSPSVSLSVPLPVVHKRECTSHVHLVQRDTLIVPESCERNPGHTHSSHSVVMEPGTI